MSNGIGKNPLNDISKVYLDQVAEKKDDSYLEPDMKKRQKNNEKARKELAKGPQMKNPHFEEKQLDPVGQEDADVDNDGKKNTKSDKYLKNRRKAIAKAIKEAKHATAKQMHSPHEVPSGDIKKLVKKAVKRIDTDVDGDTDKNDKAKGELGEFIPGVGNKRLYSTTKTTTAKEGYSNWRDDLREVVGDEGQDSKKIKEKKINNKIKINPSFGEAIEEIGGTIIEMIEVDVFEDAKMGKQSDEKLSSLHKQVSSADQSLPSNQFMLKRVQKEINRRKKATKTEGYNIGEQDESDSKDDQMIQKRKQMLQKQYMLDKQRLQMQKQGKLPSGHRVEQVEVEGFVPMNSEKMAKVDRQIGRTADKESIEQGKSKKYGRDEGKIDKLYKRQIAMKFQKKMKKEEFVSEEGADSLKDRRMERGGVDGNNRYNKAPGKPNTFGKKIL